MSKVYRFFPVYMRCMDCSSGMLCRTSCPYLPVSMCCLLQGPALLPTSYQYDYLPGCLLWMSCLGVMYLCVFLTTVHGCSRDCSPSLASEAPSFSTASSRQALNSAAVFFQISTWVSQLSGEDCLTQCVLQQLRGAHSCYS